MSHSKGLKACSNLRHMTRYVAETCRPNIADEYMCGRTLISCVYAVTSANCSLSQTSFVVSLRCATEIGEEARSNIHDQSRQRFPSRTTFSLIGRNHSPHVTTAASQVSKEGALELGKKHSTAWKNNRRGEG